MFQFKVLTIFYRVYKYFCSFSKISYEFYVFDLDQSSFIFYSKLGLRAQRTTAAPQR